MKKSLLLVLLWLGMLLGILGCSDDDNPPQPTPPVILQGCEILCDGPGCPTNCDDIVSSENLN